MSEQIGYSNRVELDVRGVGTFDACPWELTDVDKVDGARSQMRLKIFLILVLVENLMLPVTDQLKQWFHFPLFPKGFTPVLAGRGSIKAKLGI